MMMMTMRNRAKDKVWTGGGLEVERAVIFKALASLFLSL